MGEAVDRLFVRDKGGGEEQEEAPDTRKRRRDKRDQKDEVGRNGGTQLLYKLRAPAKV
jgi:hypothetical protein